MTKTIKNPYRVLQVDRNAHEDVVIAAYRELAKHHRNNQDKLKELNIAKDLILDPDERARYDKNQHVKGKVVGNYRILEQIAEGGFGKTYRAEQLHLNTPVCIKHANNISTEDEEIILEEAKAIWDLRHFGIPAIRDILRFEDDSLALVMSYIPGPTLEQLVQKKGGLDCEHVAWITERVLNILKYLHFHGVVHGDVKPQNIIVQPEKHSVVLVDYGLSLVKPSKSTKNKGYTPYFCAPEQLLEDAVLLPESDFYSLGITMIHALGGDVGTKQVPEHTPDPMCAFIKSLIKKDILSRPNWKKEDLQETFQVVREKSFGRKVSGMKPL